MSRFAIQILAAVVLLMAGPSGGAHGADASSRAPLVVETIGASGHLNAGDALPAPGFLAATAGAELDSRTGRSTTSRHSPLHAPANIRIRPQAGGVHSVVHHSCDIASRLQRGGLASSSLGTPPPNP
ncbi:MAG TPA: hypothetical protein VK933_17575 [Longimicrobiales bacterium]|nr:hypothetical protein [Longimicrobiales bacterium]